MTQHEMVNTQAWVAAGVQHAVLVRSLPALRHDLAGPLSMMRMGVAVLKRRLAPEDGAAERVEQLEAHLAGMGDHLRRLRHWDPQSAECQPLHATLAEAAALARPLLALRGVRLQPPPDAGPQAAETPAPHQALLYAVLAAIYHLAEAPGAPPAEITVQPGARSLRIAAQGTVAPDALPPLVTASAQPALAIDGAALRCLAAHLGLVVRVEAGLVEIGLPEG